MRTQRVTVVALLVCTFALSACGDSSDSGTGTFDGVWSGTVVDTLNPAPIRIELEQRHEGTALHGVVRSISDGAIHYARFTGTASTIRFNGWRASPVLSEHYGSVARVAAGA